jgi:hypothetical protein
LAVTGQVAPPWEASLPEWGQPEQEPQSLWPAACLADPQPDLLAWAEPPHEPQHVSPASDACLADPQPALPPWGQPLHDPQSLWAACAACGSDPQPDLAAWAEPPHEPQHLSPASDACFSDPQPAFFAYGQSSHELAPFAALLFSHVPQQPGFSACFAGWSVHWATAIVAKHANARTETTLRTLVFIGIPYQLVTLELDTFLPRILQLRSMHHSPSRAPTRQRESTF